MSSPYQILKVTPGASLKTIKSAYYGLAKQCHPDSRKAHAHMTEKEKSAQRELFTKVKAAYELLKDDKARRLYDSSGIGWEFAPRGRRTTRTAYRNPTASPTEEWYKSNSFHADYGQYQRRYGAYTYADPNINWQKRWDNPEREYQQRTANADGTVMSEFDPNMLPMILFGGVFAILGVMIVISVSQMNKMKSQQLLLHDQAAYNLENARKGAKTNQSDNIEFSDELDRRRVLGGDWRS